MDDVRILPVTTGVYDIRRVVGKVLIHLGVVTRTGRDAWSASAAQSDSWTSAPTRREAIAYLVEADAVAPTV